MSASHVSLIDRSGEARALQLAEYPRHALAGMVGQSPAMERLFTQMRCTAPHLRIASIEGGPGSGKRAVALALHLMGPGAVARFVPCRASEFFSEDSHALLAEAGGGTLYLSRIEELNAGQQSRLLEFLEWLEHQFARGTAKYIPRQLFAGSERPLRKLAASGEMRAELCHRLTAIHFLLPALRERREDISVLAEHFVRQFSSTHGKPMRGLGPGTLPRLMAHSWPGNVRELESVVYSAALGCEGQWVRPIDIPALVQASAPPAMPPTALENHPAEGMDPNLDEAILRHVTRVLGQVNGNKLRAAQLLGISRSTLYRLLEAGSLSA